MQERGMRVFGPGARELLRCVDETGSLSQGAKKMGMSYSKAWRMVGEIERGLGVVPPPWAEDIHAMDAGAGPRGNPLRDRRLERERERG